MGKKKLDFEYEGMDSVETPFFEITTIHYRIKGERRRKDIFTRRPGFEESVKNAIARWRDKHKTRE